MCKKLQSAAANTASWTTNVGNERGEIVTSVLTASEGIESLKGMADGLISRYRSSHQPPPIILYTDRDCCCSTGPSKFQILFASWDAMEVRLDIWHFMRRIAGDLTTESHPLYGTFMARLSNCIFEWDLRDVEVLISAKKEHLKAAVISDPSDSAARKATTRKELARHCRRCTRGVEQTISLI